MKNDPFPYIPNGKIGLFPIGKELGIELIDPLDPNIVTEDGKVCSSLNTDLNMNLYIMDNPQYN